MFVLDNGKTEKTGKEVLNDKNSEEAQMCYLSLPYARSYHKDAKAPKDPRESECSESNMEKAEQDRKAIGEIILSKRAIDLAFDKDGDGYVTGYDMIITNNKIAKCRRKARR